MEQRELLQKLDGIQSVESVMDILNVDRRRAIYYIYRLRKEGYVKTRRQSTKRRVYTISLDNKLGGTSYSEVINTYSPIKISTSAIHRIYGAEPSLEETLIYAIKTKSLRTILASLALFKRINNWVKLYKLAKENHIERQVGVLYDLARQIMKVRKMTLRFRHNSLPPKRYKSEYIIMGLKSRDFTKIEQIWKMYLPFNITDLEEYR